MLICLSLELFEEHGLPHPLVEHQPSRRLSPKKASTNSSSSLSKSQTARSRRLNRIMAPGLKSMNTPSQITSNVNKTRVATPPPPPGGSSNNSSNPSSSRVTKTSSRSPSKPKTKSSSSTMNNSKIINKTKTMNRRRNLSKTMNPSSGRSFNNSPQKINHQTLPIPATNKPSFTSHLSQTSSTLDSSAGRESMKQTHTGSLSRVSSTESLMSLNPLDEFEDDFDINLDRLGGNVNNFNNIGHVGDERINIREHMIPRRHPSHMSSPSPLSRDMSCSPSRGYASQSPREHENEDNKLSTEYLARLYKLLHTDASRTFFGTSLKIATLVHLITHIYLVKLMCLCLHCICCMYMHIWMATSSVAIRHSPWR